MSVFDSGMDRIQNADDVTKKVFLETRRLIDDQGAHHFVRLLELQNVKSHAMHVE